MMSLRDDVHTHFVTLIVKWTIVGGWVKPLDDKRGKMGTIKSPTQFIFKAPQSIYKCFLNYN